MKKKIVSFLLALTVITGASVFAAGNASITLKIGENHMNVGGKTVNLDVPATIINDRTMVPLRALFEAIDASVNYDNETRTIFIRKDDTIIVMQVGQAAMFINGTKKEIDAPSVIVNDRTLVPLRAISESLGRQVDYDSKTKTVTVK